MFLRPALLFVAAAACGCAGPARGPHAPPAGPPPSAAPLGPTTRDYHQEHLALDLDVDMDHATVSGTATHTLTALADLSQVRMHLEDMAVSRVTSDGGAACAASQDGGILAIALDRPRRKGERFTLAIRYGGAPLAGLRFVKPTAEHPEIPLQLWSDGGTARTRHWIPCYDLPDDRLTTSMRVVTPAGLQMIGNGAPSATEALPDGRVAHTWVADRPYTTDFVTLVVGAFDDVRRAAGRVEEHDLAPPGWGERCAAVFGRTPEILSFFEDFTGERFPWPRYSHVAVWDFPRDAVAGAGAATLGLRALGGEGAPMGGSPDEPIARALARQWFGGLVSCRTPDDAWLDEGLATFLAALWTERDEGPEAFAVRMLRKRDACMSAVGAADVAARAADRGACVLHMLRKIVGDDAFRRGVRRYLKDNLDASVGNDALRAAMQTESKQDLRWFFDQWVRSSGFPELTVSAAPHNDARHTLTLLVEQTQPAPANLPAFRLPTEIEYRWAASKATVRRRVEITRRRQDLTLGGMVPADGESTPADDPIVLFDPDHVLLARVHEMRSRPDWEWELRYGPNVVGRLLAARATPGYGDEAGDALSICVGAELGAGGRTGLVFDPRFEVRAEACASLGKIPFDEDAEHLLVAAEDKDGRVRRAAMEAMANHNPVVVVESLKKHLADDPDGDVAAAAAGALGRTKAKGAFDALVGALGRESAGDRIRQGVLDGLRKLGDARGAAVVLPYLDYSWGKGMDHALRRAALGALVALAPADSETRRRIVELLHDPYPAMRDWAAAAAAELGTASPRAGAPTGR